MSQPRRSVRWAALFIIVVLLTVGWWTRRGRDGPRLLWTKDAGGFGIGVVDDASGRPWSFGSIPLCLDRTGQVHVERAVQLNGDGGVRLVRIALRPLDGLPPKNGKPYMLVTEHSDLRTVGFVNDQRRVDVRCDWSGGSARPNHILMYELGVEIRLTGGARGGSFQGVRLDYESRGRTRHLVVPWSFRLCPPNPANTCPPPDLLNPDNTRS